MILKALLFFSFFLLLTPVAEAQSITSVMRHDAPEDVAHGQVSLLLEESIYHTYSDHVIHTTRRQLNRQNRLLAYVKLDEEGKPANKITIAYDSTGLHSLTRTIENWSRLIKYEKKTFYYTYDSLGYLVKQLEKDGKGEILFQTIIKNNEHGHPEKVEVYDAYGQLVGVETAKYDYDENTFVTRVTGKANFIQTSSPLVIYPEKELNEIKVDSVFNNRGVLVKTEQQEQKYWYDAYGERKEGQFTNTVKTYDDKGNWTEKKIYNIVKGKQKPDTTCKRTIYYHK